MAKGTRERIVEVAVRLFAERGVASTPVTAIESAAGLSPGSGSFYRHFKDRTELLAAVVERELTRVKKNPAVQVSQAGTQRPPAEALAAQLLADLDFLRELQPLIAILMWERQRAPGVAERVRTLMVERGVELGMADLLFRAPADAVGEDPAAAATVMMSAMVGYFLSVEYFGSAPAEVDGQRFTNTLAKLLTAK
ncbi:TetR/AcrR family transcriptional regulator [Amycolatopsis nigrescens]|uniref:TetR/AcrR family transcriptional regulator n=1 Tax=Amycolatopsis nigrescens TaxID=381445 RepID=UPI000377F795|nr:TetR family transcriptional regulator [Amycolatopsis nigrescens]